MKLVRKQNDFFPSVWEDFFGRDWFDSPGIVQAGVTVPAVNVRETAAGFHIEVAAPGMKKEDFSLNLDRNLLTISAEERSEQSEKDTEGKYTRREFSYRSFKRAFTLPEAADSDKVEATYKDGILTIAVPKKEEAKPKPIRVIEVGN